MRTITSDRETASIPVNATNRVHVQIANGVSFDLDDLLNFSMRFPGGHCDEGEKNCVDYADYRNRETRNIILGASQVDRQKAVENKKQQ
jgi:hypothetical protein